ncbi:putative metallopeptidase [Clostridium algidicarnis]|uniref:putative metallopeptidase n=1 Tax=Clostridium algidicarnis TaxID=37659 RepID=UPI003FD73110
MPRIRIFDESTGEVKDIDCVGYNLQYAESTGDGRIQKIRELNNGKYGLKHWIKNDFYKPLAQKIKDKYREDIPGLSLVNLDRILWIEDMDYVGDEVKRDDDVMWIKKVPKQLTELTGYQFIVESREFWMSRISNEQIVAHIYSCLRQIENGDKLITPDLIGWKEVIGNLGLGWQTTMTPIPNLLDGFDTEDFKMLKKADKQIKFDLAK